MILVAVSMCGTARSAEPSAGWDLTKIDGREYVSVDSIKKFYNFSKISRVGRSIVLENAKVEMNLKIGGNECLMNNVKFVFSHDIATVGDKIYVSRIDLAKLIDPVLRPNFIQNAGDFRTVILDPGHGGKDPGATNPYGTEANYNLKVAGLVKKQLEAKGFKVVMTRKSNEYLSLQERVNFANAVKENAIYVSIHFNSGGSAARGIETFTLSPPGVPHYDANFKPADLQTRAGNEHDSANIALATSVHGSILRRLGKNTLDRGIKRARFSVLSGVQPSCDPARRRFHESSIRSTAHRKRSLPERNRHRSGGRRREIPLCRWPQACRRAEELRVIRLLRKFRGSPPSSAALRHSDARNAPGAASRLFPGRLP